MRNLAFENLHHIARELFESALRAVDAHAAITRNVDLDGATFTIKRGGQIDLTGKEVYVVAFGKAASRMAEGLAQILGERITAGVISGPGLMRASIGDSAKWHYFVGGHPLPDQNSLKAAQAAFDLLERAENSHGLVIFLISGGGSAMIEWPIALDITLEDLRHANHLLVNCGASINEINAVRRAFSAVKGGRLAARAPNARQVNLIISDVNAGDEANVASGPTLLPLDSPDPKVVISQYHLVESLPYSVLSAIQKYSREPIAALSSETHVLLSNDSAVEAAARKASELGFKTEILSDICEQPIERGCDLLLERVSQIDDTHSEPVCLLSGGEFACPVRGDGKGGRNLETVLRCVIGFRRLQTNNHVIVLSVGTDGIDGNSPAAGAIGDETSCARALAEGLDADDYLARSDSFTFFDSLGDAIITGPTGTNVRDLRVILISNNLGSLRG